jgi:hypothetical protein
MNFKTRANDLAQAKEPSPICARRWAILFSPGGRMGNPIVFFHSRLAITVILFAFALGVWGAINYLRGQGVGSSYWGALIIGEIVAIVQALVGVILIFTVQVPSDLIHLLYGSLVALAFPGVYIYTHARTGRAEMGIYALVAFFIFGLGLRAMTTGG